MRFSCWKTKATNRQSECIIFITFPRQQRLRERTSIIHCMHISSLVTYEERNGYWFYVCKFYMNCTALRHTGHSDGFISITETGIAQLLQVLGYVLCNRGHTVRFLLCKRLFYIMCRPDLGPTTPYKLGKASTVQACNFLQNSRFGVALPVLSKVQPEGGPATAGLAERLECSSAVSSRLCDTSHSQAEQADRQHY
jgi:hypothetical protein